MRDNDHANINTLLQDFRRISSNRLLSLIISQYLDCINPTALRFVLSNIL